MSIQSLSVNALRFSYPDHIVFDEACFDIPMNSERGHIAALMGPSGCGKTTLLRLLAGVLKPTSGTIQFLPSVGRIEYLPQEPVMFAHMTTQENARFYERIRAQKSHYRQDLLDGSIAVLNIKQLLDSAKSIEDLSGGEKQRVALVRSLSVQPQVLLLDEPCAGLDASVKQDFLVRLREMVDRFSLLAIYATHHADEALTVADSVLYLSRRASTDNTVDVMQMSAQGFIDKPPTVHAAQIVAHGPMNLIQHCGIQCGMVKLSNGDAIAVCDDAICHSPTYTIVFEPDAIRVSAKSGVGTVATFLAQSACYGVYQLVTQDRILIPSTHTKRSSLPIVVRGTAIVFPEGRAGKRVTLNCPGVPS